MNNILLVQEIYRDGFKDLGGLFFRYSLWLYTWFSFAMIALGVYVLISKVGSGYF